MHQKFPKQLCSYSSPVRETAAKCAHYCTVVFQGLLHLNIAGGAAKAGGLVFDAISLGAGVHEGVRQAWLETQGSGLCQDSIQGQWFRYELPWEMIYIPVALTNAGEPTECESALGIPALQIGLLGSCMRILSALRQRRVRTEPMFLCF